MADSANTVVIANTPAEGTLVYDSKESDTNQGDTIRIVVRSGTALIRVKNLHNSTTPAARYEEGEEALFSLGGQSLEEVWVLGSGGAVTIDYNIVATRFI